MGQAFPAAPDAVDLVAKLGCAIDDALDHGVESGDVAAPGQDADARGSSHACLPWVGRGRGGGRDVQAQPIPAAMDPSHLSAYFRRRAHRRAKSATPDGSFCARAGRSRPCG